MTTPNSDELSIVNSLEHVRKNRALYLNGAQPCGETLSARLVSDLIWLGALPASVEKKGEWWIISSPIDWASGDDLENLYSRITSDDRLGANSYRAEILLSAFAHNIFTCTVNGLVWIKKADTRLPGEFKEVICGRAIGFTI